MRRLFLLALLLSASAPPVKAQGDSAQRISLAEAISRGRLTGVQANLGRLLVEQTQSRIGQRNADRLPQVTGRVSTERQTVNLSEFGIGNFGGVTDPFNVFRARVGVSQLLFDKATFDRLKIVRDSLASVDQDARHAGEISAALAGAAWLRLVSALETVQARTSDSITAYAFLRIASEQVDAGTAARIERTRSETQAATVRTQLSLARYAVQRAQVDLDRTIGLPPGTPVLPAGDPVVIYDTAPTDASGAVALALANRTDLAAARDRISLAERSLKAIHDEFLPSLMAQGYLQTSGTKLSDMDHSWNVGVGLNWPVFDGFRRSRRAEEQQVRIDGEKMRTLDLQQQIEADAREAMIDLTAANEQLTLAGERVRLADQEVSEAADRLSAGVTGTSETTRAQSELASARDNLIQARVSVGAAQLSAAATFGLLNRIH